MLRQPAVKFLIWLGLTLAGGAAGALLALFGVDVYLDHFDKTRPLLESIVWALALTFWGLGAGGGVGLLVAGLLAWRWTRRLGRPD